MKIFKRIFYIVFIVILISVMLVSITMFLKDKKQDKEEQEVFEDLITIIENNDDTNREDNADYSMLFKQNQDMIAWIKIEDTNINYPVMQTKDRPNYYLRKDFYKEYSYYGTPYMQENCDIDLSDNLIIYGHHIKNSSMFGVLEKYKNKEFYNDHKEIKFITKGEVNRYEIVYTFKTSATRGFEYYKYIDFNNKSEFNTFNTKCKELAFFDTNISSNYGDKYITLSTCDYTMKNGRFVVIAKKI